LYIPPKDSSKSPGKKNLKGFSKENCGACKKVFNPPKKWARKKRLEIAAL